LIYFFGIFIKNIKMSEEIESGNHVVANEALAAPICTCGPDLARNGGYMHNYVCPMTPKCEHLITRINLQTGEREQRPCGSRLEPNFANHGHGCPLLLLCPHCGTSMDRRGIHNINCPNRQYSRIFPDVRAIVRRLSDEFESLLAMHARRISPQITDGEFEIHGECSICVCPINPSDQALKPSGCIHCFHETCLMQWVQSNCSNNDKCPDCRAVIGTILKKN
jgi:hypothetical protein